MHLAFVGTIVPNGAAKELAGQQIMSHMTLIDQEPMQCINTIEVSVVIHCMFS